MRRGWSTDKSLDSDSFINKISIIPTRRLNVSLSWGLPSVYELHTFHISIKFLPLSLPPNTIAKCASLLCEWLSAEFRTLITCHLVFEGAHMYCCCFFSSRVHKLCRIKNASRSERVNCEEDWKLSFSTAILHPSTTTFSLNFSSRHKNWTLALLSTWMLLISRYCIQTETRTIWFYLIALIGISLGIFRLLIAVFHSQYFIFPFSTFFCLFCVDKL